MYMHMYIKDQSQYLSLVMFSDIMLHHNNYVFLFGELHVHVHVHIHKHTHVHVHIHVHVHVHVHIHVHVHVHVYVHVIYIYVIYQVYHININNYQYF